MQDAMEKAAALIEAMPYLRRFSGKEVVIKFGGSTMESPEVVDDILEDVVFMATVGIRPILVHGGGKKISRAMDEAGLRPRFVSGYRVTDQAALNVVVDVLGDVNSALVEGVCEHGGGALSGFCEHQSVLAVEKKRLEGTGSGDAADIGYVGDVVSVDVQRIRSLEERCEVLIIPPIGQDANGQLYNVNADSAAAAIAAELGAEKIVFLSDVHGIMERSGDEGSFLSSLDRTQVARLIDEGVIRGGMLPKVEGCLHAIESGVRKAHIIDGGLQHSLLLEIFTDEGVGTQIVGKDGA